MAKDPFNELPTIEPEGEPEHPSGFDAPAKESPAEVAAGSPPRNLIKTATTIAVPLIVGATLVWLFFSPDNPRAGKRVEVQQVSVDTKQQSAETASMLKQLKTDAEKPKPVAVPVMPGSLPAGQLRSGMSPAGQPPIPPGLTTQQRSGYTAAGAPTAPVSYGSPATQVSPAYGPQAYPPTASPVPAAMSEEAAKEARDRIAAAQKREEEIRAAPLEAGQVRLLSQGSSADAAKEPAALSDLQADIAGERAAAMRSQQSMQEQMLAAMSPKETIAKTKGANQDFLESAGASATARPQVTSLQSAAGQYLVGEGAVIRSVLLTNVNSDLPGRILARVTSDVYDSTQRYVVIPKGSLLNGVYNSQVIVGQERLLMAMTRLTMPNGNWLALNGNGATDMMGTSGVAAEVDNHFMKMFGSSLIVGASTLLLPRADTSVTTLPGTTGTSGAATAGSLFATTLNEVLKGLLDRNKNIAPTLRLKAGDEFIFMANQDMMMTPYR